MHGREHLPLTQELVVVLLGLGVEARIVIRIVALRTGGGGEHRLVQAPHTTGAGLPIPAVVAAFRIRVAIADQALAARFLRREQRIESEQPQAPRLLEVRIDRHWLDFGPSEEVVPGVMTDLDVVDDVLFLAGTNVLALAIVEAQIVVVSADRTEHVVPHDFRRYIRVVRIDQRKCLAGDVADHAAMIVSEPYLRGILFRRLSVRRRPIDPLGRYDVHVHSMSHRVIHPGRNQVFDLRRVFGRYGVPRLHCRICWRHDETQEC